jgi:hypothetical protein
MANRPKKTPANPGRASIDLGGIMGAAGMGGDAGPAIVEDGGLMADAPVELDRTSLPAEGGASQQPSMPQLRVEGKPPGMFRNMLTRGQAGENYQRASNQVNMTNHQNRFSLMADEIQSSRALENAKALQQSGMQAQLDQAKGLREQELSAQHLKDMEMGEVIAANQGRSGLAPEELLNIGRSHRYETTTLPEMNKNLLEKAKYISSTKTDYGRGLLAESAIAELGAPGRKAEQERSSIEATKAGTEATRANIPINQAASSRAEQEFNSFGAKTKRGLVDLGGSLLSEQPISSMGFVSGQVPATGEREFEVMSPDGMTKRRVVKPAQAGRIETQTENLGSVEELLRKIRLQRSVGNTNQ